MTQTDYDKALTNAIGNFDNYHFKLTCDERYAYKDAFCKGYEFGKEANQLNEDNFAKSGNEQTEHSADERKKMRMEIAMRAMQALIDGSKTTQHYQRTAQLAVNYADSLIAELEK